MGVLSQLVGLGLLVAWAAIAFGWPAGLLAGGIECLLVGIALGDVPLPRPRVKRPRRRAR